MFQWNVMKVEAPSDRPLEWQNRKGLDWNPCDKWGDTRTNWVQNQNSYCSPATAPESLLALVTSLRNLQQRQKAYWYTRRSQINPQVHEYHYSFHPGVFQGIYFHGEREVL
jgi:hypothetical protein